VNKFHIIRDNRQKVDGEMAGWRAVEPKLIHQTIPVIDWNKERQRYLSPAALELKRKTPLFR